MGDKNNPLLEGTCDLAESWKVILKMFHDNAVALNTLKLQVIIQGLVSS